MFEGQINFFIVVREGHRIKSFFFEATGWKFLFSESLKAAIDRIFMWIAYETQIADFVSLIKIFTDFNVCWQYNILFFTGIMFHI